ncbi:thiol-disulfide isomerase/thioredoxin [Sulfuritortus calidifontis]|uniref:Thiol-disulfide isomerase/thioredoxin n=1 Tax=Sulfuritortus calidifontis TaxID=1914471 RepID=A0A4V2UQQ2_9PROT|nr:TlpA disulfide reductase family protein [Sulfuritortus calidifontis]TCS71902.1 thiol-disulfide isomerase/thioredoxin [Sulfuritortus calidifontis]
MTKTSWFLQKLKANGLTLLLIGLIVYFWFRPPASVDHLHLPAPEVNISTPAGEKPLSAWRGQVLLVNFWATWCPYCRHEMPAMQAFYQAHKHEGFEILALSLDANQAEVDAFMREKDYSFPAPLALAGTSQQFGGVDKVPTSFVIDRRGVIRHKISGQVHRARLEELVLPLLAERPDSSAPVAQPTARPERPARPPAIAGAGPAPR